MFLKFELKMNNVSNWTNNVQFTNILLSIRLLKFFFNLDIFSYTLVILSVEYFYFGYYSTGYFDLGPTKTLIFGIWVI